MIKIVIKGIIIVTAFLLMYNMLMQVDWVRVLKIQKISDKTEEKISNFILDYLEQTEDSIETDSLQLFMDEIIVDICRANRKNPDNYKVILIDKAEVNAFALPAGYIIVYSELLKECSNASELSGVMAHEMAHIDLRHVSKKLIREFGVSVLLAGSAGGGAETIQQILYYLSSAGFDRGMEKQADLKAVDYLLNAKINPVHLAVFFEKLSLNRKYDGYNLAWLSTHPSLENRMDYITQYIARKDIEYRLPRTSMSWESFSTAISRY